MRKLTNYGVFFINQLQNTLDDPFLIYKIEVKVSYENGIMKTT